VLRLSVRSVRGHLVRFLLTALAVTLGVAFVAGSFVLRDSIDATLDRLLSSASKGVDVTVRGAEIAGGHGVRAPVPLTLADRLARVDGVARSRADFQGSAMLVGQDGLVVRNGGAPTFGFAYRPDDPAFTLVRGRGPTRPGEIVVERATLEKSGLAVGDTTQAVVGQEARTVRVTGEVEFGSLFGATALFVDEATARRAFAADGTVSSVSLTAEPGVGESQLRARVARVLPSGVEAVTATTLQADSRSSVETGLGFVTTFLLAFAGVTLFVGGFIIVNTFSILLAQRTRELALLRAVGASRAQVRRLVLGEAVIIGLLGSALGLGVGAGLAAGLKAVMKNLVGIDISGGLPIAARTIWVSFGVGVVVTLLAALMPAYRAARIAPVAAMRDDMVAPRASILRRGLVGLTVLTAGAALLTVAVTRTDVSWPLVGLGAALLLVGAPVAAPLAARPVVHVIVWPFVRLGGVVGRLAGQNALRVPRRTANTASALMIGLALVSGLAVVASSIKASVSDLVAQQLTSDFVLSAGGSATVPTSIAAKAADLPGAGSVATLSAVNLSVGGLDADAIAATGPALAENVRIEMLSGSVTSLDRGQLLVNESTATEKGWHVGSPVVATVGTKTGQRLTVGGVYRDSQLLSSPFIVGRGLYTQALPEREQKDMLVLVKARPGADTAALKASLVRLVKPYLVVSVETGDEYVDSAAAQVDQILGLFYVLLALAIVIAVLGIVNTLALSVVERTREIGLLRAVGLARSQLSRMIGVEAIATAVFGAVLGTALGLGLGTACQHALRNDGLEVLDIPWSMIATVVVAAAVVGIAAAVLPAVRAVRLNVLQAIATD
jgi:putative ABC transport system permease protein